MDEFSGRTAIASAPKRSAWQRLADFDIGIIPLPIFVFLLLVIAVMVITGAVSADITTNIGLLSLGGFASAELGRHLPFVRRIGAGAIIAIFIPSYFAYAHLLPKSVVVSITDFTRQSNLLFLFIAAVIVGSIFGMDRKTLISGFFRIFVPLAAGSLAATLFGTLTGMAFGMSARHALFFLVVPVMAGGVGEGAIPLSIGYGAILGVSHADMFAELLPAVMIGGFFAIVFAGSLNLLGRRVPHLTGNGRLQPGEPDDIVAPAATPPPTIDVATIAAAGILATTLYLTGVLAQRLLGWPAPVVMLLLAVLMKLCHAVPPNLQAGAAIVYRFFAVAVTYPLLFAIGVAMTPWDKLTSALSLPNVATIFATVAAMMGVGFLVARFVKMYPIDVAIVTACHCGQGGTGDVAILSAANRMQLMPFAQIATRIAGAITVTLALIALAALK